MKAYRNNVVIRLILGICLLAIVLFALCFGFPNQLTTLSGNQAWTDFWQGLQIGLFTALAIASSVFIIRNIIVLRNPQKLKAAYIKEHDERCQKIASEVGKNSYLPEVILLLIACVIAGYYSMIVSLTILGVIVFHSIVRILMNIYYRRRF